MFGHIESFQHKRKHNGIRFGIFVAGIILAECIYALYQFQLRKGLFVDEIYTYGLSNSHYAPFLIGFRPTIWKTWTSGESLLNYITVQPNQRFDYASVFFNQANDVHPPLYYLLVHTICSLFPNQFSYWYAESINLVALPITLIVLFLLCRRIFAQKEMALCVLVLYGFSMAAAENAGYLRMYMLLTMWSTISLYLHQRLLAMPTISVPLLAGLWCVTYLGSLTQYYFIIYSFFLAALSCLLLFKKREFKKVFFYALCMASAVFAMMITFPAWFQQLFGNTFMGEATLESATHFPDFLRVAYFVYCALELYFGNNTSLTVFGAGVLAIVLLVSVLFRLTGKNKAHFFSLPINWENIVLGGSTVLTFLAVSQLAVYVTKRYIFFLAPGITIIIVKILVWAFKGLRLASRKIGCILVFLALAESVAGILFFKTSMLYYNGIYETQELMQQYSDLNGIAFASGGLVTQNLLEFSQMKEIYCTDITQSDEIPEILLGKDISKGIIVWIDMRQELYSEEDATNIVNCILECGLFNDYTLLYQFNNARAYYFM